MTYGRGTLGRGTLGRGTLGRGTLDVGRLTSHVWRFFAAALMLVPAGCTSFTTSQDSIPGERTGAQAARGADSSAQAGRGADTGPLSPEASLTSFRLDPDLEIRVFAAEPHVRDPVDLVFDAHGRAYVAEMLDYPDDPQSTGPARSRIRFLEDADDDGQIDGSVVFADSIAHLTGMQPWMDGLIVTAAPDILYLRDRDGDGRADERQVLFTGFALTNPQHIVSSPRFALDNWIYVANDGQPADVCAVSFPSARGTSSPDEEAFPSHDGAHSPDEAAACVSVLGADFRFRMDRPAFEAASGPAQFGHTFDAAGRRFIMHNTVHVRHVVLERKYLERNPLLPVRASAQDISNHGLRVFQATSPQDWRVARTDVRSRRYEAEQVGWTEHLEGHFTGVAGGVIYLGSALGDAYRGDLFTGEVAANLIHRDVLTVDGPSFTATRAAGERDREFLVSTDPWFRPVNLTVGPDGSLFVVDMYREFIESPEYIPEGIRDSLDFSSGTMHGRIYRIRRRDADPRAPAAWPRDIGSVDPLEWPGDAGTNHLVRLLEHPDQWWRLAAHRLLIERKDPSAVPFLVETVTADASPAARIHAIHILESFGTLRDSVVATALHDSDPEVLEHALSMAEAYPALAEQIIRHIDHPDPRVRIQAALSAASLPQDEAVSALFAFAAEHAGEPWADAAILIAPPQLHFRLLERLLEAGSRFLDRLLEEGSRPGAVDDAASGGLLHDLAFVIGARGDVSEIGGVIERLRIQPGLAAPPLRDAVAGGLAEGLALAGIRRLEAPEAASALASLTADTSVIADTSQDANAYLIADTEDGDAGALESLANRIRIPGRIEAAVIAASNRELSLNERERAVRRSASGAFGRVEPVLTNLLGEAEHPGLQIAALDVLSTFDDAVIAGVILSYREQLSPRDRPAAWKVLAGRTTWLMDLLDAMASGSVDPAAADAEIRLLALDHPDPAIRDRASALFDEDPAADAVDGASEASLIDDPARVLSLTGHAEDGRGVFYAQCAACHSPSPRALGPNLIGVSNKSREQLLEAIVAPGRAIPGSYAAYVVELTDGSIASGRVVSESPGILTLRSLAGDLHLLRSRIAKIRQAERSLMPPEAAGELSPQQLADVIAFLRAARE